MTSQLLARGRERFDIFCAPCHSPSDVPIGRVLAVTLASLVVLALTGLALWVMMRLFAESIERPQVSPVERTRIETPPPLLQTAPENDLRALRAREEAVLNEWQWMDRAGGIAQIPIERAMEVLAERGWPQPDGPASPIPNLHGGELAPERSPQSSFPPEAPPQISPQQTGSAQDERHGGTQ